MLTNSSKCWGQTDETLFVGRCSRSYASSEVSLILHLVNPLGSLVLLCIAILLASIILYKRIQDWRAHNIRHNPRFRPFNDVPLTVLRLVPCNNQRTGKENTEAPESYPNLPNFCCDQKFRDEETGTHIAPHLFEGYGLICLARF
jgi:hypothetical protein